MVSIVGIALIGLAIGALFFVLPRNGKVASFVGGRLEGVIVLGIVAALFVGLMLVIMGPPHFLKR